MRAESLLKPGWSSVRIGEELVRSGDECQGQQSSGLERKRCVRVLTVGAWAEDIALGWPRLTRGKVIVRLNRSTPVRGHAPPTTSK